MARINSYPRDLDVDDKDAWIGTESNNRQTRNFTAEAVAKYLNIKGKISISGQMVFKFASGATKAGEFTGPADGSALTGLTTLEISGVDSSGQDTVAFMQYIVDNDILISEQNEISNFGHFKILSYTLNGGVYTLDLVNIGGNGNLVIDKYYDLATFTISSRADKTFVFVQGVPATTWNITHNLSKFPSVSVINNNNIVINGEVTYIDNNNVQLNFSAGFSGTAYLN